MIAIDSSQCKAYGSQHVDHDHPLSDDAMLVPVGQSPKLRKCTGQEGAAILTGGTAGPDEEDDVLTTLQAGFDLAEVLFTVLRAAC